MSIYAISDLHLSLSTDKLMDKFYGWENYIERIKANWNRLVKAEDTVIVPGDISWALKLEESLEDLKFLNELNGEKIILKGNHDLWWPTMNKLNNFLKTNNLDKIKPLFNNCYEIDNVCICGTRGWFFDAPEKEEKVILREAGRLETSLEKAKALGKKPLVFLHYPPVYDNNVCKPIFEIIKKYNITTVYHGHIHGNGMNNAQKEFDGVNFKLLSADCINFTPFYITL